MKIQINVSDENYEKISKMLASAGVEIDDDGDFIISEKDRFAQYIIAKDKNGEKVKLMTEEIIFIESFGHSVEIHSTEGRYISADRLYQFTSILDNSQFLRVSNCAIISKTHIKKVKPSLSMKFILTMSDGSLVDVTRSYYNVFKEFFGI